MGRKKKNLLKNFIVFVRRLVCFSVSFLIFFRWGVPAVMDGWYYHTTVVAFGPSAVPDVGLAWLLGCGSG